MNGSWAIRAVSHPQLMYKVEDQIMSFVLKLLDKFNIECEENFIDWGFPINSHYYHSSYPISN